MTQSPWAVDEAAHASLEDKLMRDECVEIITRIRELIHFAKSDGRIDDIQAMRLFLMAANFIGFANRRPEVTDMELKAVLQSEFDETFRITRLVVNSAKGAPPL